MPSVNPLIDGTCLLVSSLPTKSLLENRFHANGQGLHLDELETPLHCSYTCYVRRSGLAYLCLALDRCRHVANPYTWYIFLLFLSVFAWYLHLRLHGLHPHLRRLFLELLSLRFGVLVVFPHNLQFLSRNSSSHPLVQPADVSRSSTLRGFIPHPPNYSVTL
jgi:hypothetical protein